MRMRRAILAALRAETAKADTFPDDTFLLARGVGRGALNTLLAAGWIEADGPMVGTRQVYRITDIGRSALVAASDS